MFAKVAAKATMASDTACVEGCNHRSLALMVWAVLVDSTVREWRRGLMMCWGKVHGSAAVVICVVSSTHRLAPLVVCPTF
jgi:hypothetical protein